MRTETLSLPRACYTFAALVGLAATTVTGVSNAAETASVSAAGSASPSWCAPEVESLPGDVCHIEGSPSKSGKRTLVVFLHGAIAKNTTWQWTQERALLRQAKYVGFEAIFPRSPLTAKGYVWPGTAAAQERDEQGLIDNWMAAKRLLEARAGRPFDEVFVMGFSSGAYFVSSLAVRNRVDVDGYAVFAGGQGGLGQARTAPRRAPVFVGVCAEDEQTAGHSRAFGAALTGFGIPHAVDEQHVGHAFSDIHVAHAVSFLRRASAKAIDAT